MPHVEVVRVEAPRTMWRITLARADVGPRIMVARTVEAAVLPVARVTARPVVGILTRIRWRIMMSGRADILVGAPVAARRTATSVAEPRAVVAPVEVPRTVRSVAEPRVATPVEALRIITSVVEPHAVVILAQVPRAATRAAARRKATSVVEPRAVVTLAQVPRGVTLVAVLRT